jgi:hypothetical protein
MIYTAPCIMFWMCANRQTDQECSGPAKSEDTGSSPGDPAQLFLKPSCRWMELDPK